MITRRTSLSIAAAAAVVLAILSSPAAAQERPGPVLEIAGGTLLFPDDGTVSEGFIGGAARFYLSPRVSVGPEIAYVNGDRHSHLMLTGNVTFDVIGPDGTEPARITPFVVVGGGLFRTSESFGGGDFTSNEGAFTAGAGIRARVSDRVTVGAEARIGWELHLRLNGFVGIRLGR